ncbi:MAG: hypothetical protein COA68_16950 [Oceanobacter sp.]|nr:MAG: hypothetical protein COA68_16950 [Oceanobacter sp.]
MSKAQVAKTIGCARKTVIGV